MVEENTSSHIIISVLAHHFRLRLWYTVLSTWPPRHNYYALVCHVSSLVLPQSSVLLRKEQGVVQKVQRVPKAPNSGLILCAAGLLMVVRVVEGGGHTRT